MHKTSTNKICIIIVPLVIYALIVFCFTRKLVGGMLNYGDAPYYYNSSQQHYLYTWDENFLGYSKSGTMFTTPLFSTITLVLERVADSNTVSYILYNTPLLALSFSAFFIMYKLGRNYGYAVVTGVLILVNNYMMEQFIYWPSTYFYGPIALLWLIYIVTQLAKNDGAQPKIYILIVLLSLLCVHPFFFVMYVAVLSVFLLYMVAFDRNKRYPISTLLITICFVVMIQAHWLIPFIYNFLDTTVEAFYAHNLTSVFQGYMNKANILNLIQYNNYPGRLDFYSKLQLLLYPFYYSFIFFSFIISLMRARIANLRALPVILFIIFFSLALGPNIPIFGKLWLLGFEKLPGAGFFRSFTRFFLVCHIVLLIYTAITIGFERQNTRRLGLLLVTLLLMGLYINAGFFSGDFNGFIISYHIPTEYHDLNRKYFSDAGEYTILSLPTPPYEAYRWSSNYHSKFPQVVYFNNYFFGKPVIYNAYARNISTLHVSPISSLLAVGYTGNINADTMQTIKEAGIRYILIRKDLLNTLDENSPLEYAHLARSLDSMPELSKTVENNLYVLYEVSNYKPRIDAQKIRISTFTKNTPVLYTVNMDKFENNKVTLTLRQNYNKGWHLYTKQPGVMNLFIKEELPAKHYKDEMGFNSWVLDRNALIGNNHVLLYFTPHLYYVLGVKVTMFLTTMCVLIFLGSWFLNVRKSMPAIKRVLVR